MEEIIRRIRLFSGTSQKEFADYMGVSFATVNRWENHHALPNKIAQMKIYDFCVSNEIPLADFIYEKVSAVSSDIILPPGRKLLYHGSKAGISGEIAPLSRDKCDFGKGFYMGTQIEQPLTLICDFDMAKLYIMSIQMEGLKILKVNAEIDWAMLVAYNRGRMERIKGTALYQKYQEMSEGCDLVIGSIANDRMFYVLDNFYLGNITDVALVKSLSALQTGEQYVAVSKKGCAAVRIEKEISFSYLERRCMQSVSEEKRNQGIHLANEICRNYRREGLFYDELLAQAEKGGTTDGAGSSAIETLRHPGQII